MRKFNWCELGGGGKRVDSIIREDILRMLKGGNLKISTG
jgi:hypothetical protein